LASNKTYPSWGYMAEQGATTIWELWNGNTASPQMNSQNHVMLLGDLLIWLYQDLAGIRSDDQAIAFNKIIMKPSFIKGLSEVNASYRSLYGVIGSHWKKTSTRLTWDVQIPANTKAILYIPAESFDQINEWGLPVKRHAGIKFLRKENDKIVIEAGSGNYSFTSTIK
jgi:alpha-L-rhamnosidase